MRSGLHVPALGLGVAIGIAAVLGSTRGLVAQDAARLPAWLEAHIGEADGQIARPVLLRARSLYVQKLSEGVVRNDCYFAMDATYPNTLNNGALARRFYEICEAEQSFRAIPAGHGGGRDLAGIADFANGRQCAKNFGNAMDSFLTTGGSYVTAETKTSFKGYYRAADGREAALMRSFVQFVGEGETANARERAIGGHSAVTMKGVCLRKDPDSPYADASGYVPFGTPVDYTGGRSDGCTSWSPADAPHLVAMVKDNPTTLYIYPDAEDVAAVARSVAAGRSPSRSGLYWNSFCLRQIGSPRYWPRAQLEPLLDDYRRAHPPPLRRPVPICGDR